MQYVYFPTPDCICLYHSSQASSLPLHLPSLHLPFSYSTLNAPPPRFSYDQIIAIPMSAQRSSRCLLCAFSRSTASSAARPGGPRREFSSSVSLFVRTKSKGGSNKSKQSSKLVSSVRQLRRYNEEEKKQLVEKYTAAQRAAIDIGEQAVGPEILATQAAPRRDPWSLQYYDDLSKIDPVVDHPIRAPYSNMDATKRLKTEDEINEDLASFVADFPEDENSPEASEAWTKFDRNLRLTVGKEESENNTRSARAPELYIPGERDLNDEIVKPLATKMFGDPKNRVEEAKDRTDLAESDPGVYRLIQITGLPWKRIRSLRFKTIIAHPVVNQTRLGKIRQMYFLSIAGDGNGLVGYGEAKGLESQEARVQSQHRAIRNMQPILRYEGRTTYGDVTGKVSATELQLFARPPGEQPSLPPISSLFLAIPNPSRSAFRTATKGNQYYRVWLAMPAIHLGDLQMCRHYRSSRSSPTIEESHEHGQGDHGSPLKPEGSR
jgi:small subunit ribosomal protein S5